MLSLFAPSTAAFSAPTVHVAQQPAVRSSPVQMAEMPSRRAALLSAAALVVPLAAQAKPEDYVGGYTTKSYLKAYGKTKESPASDPNSPLIKFKLGDPPVTAAAIKPKEEPKKEEPKKEEPKA